VLTSTDYESDKISSPSIYLFQVFLKKAIIFSLDCLIFLAVKSMLRAAAIERKYGNLYFSACCNRNCLPVKDKDGNFDLEKTTKILKYCEAQMIDISGSKKERLNWFIQKLNSCFTSVGANGRLGFNYHIGGINPYDDLRVSDDCQKTFTRAYGITIDKLEHFQRVFKDRKLLKGRFDHDGQQIEPPPNIDAMNGLGAGNGRIKPLNNIHEAKSLVFEDYDLDSTFVETVPKYASHVQFFIYEVLN